MRKIKQIDRPFRIVRHRLGKVPWSFDCRPSRESAEAVAEKLRSKHPKEKIEVVHD